jgi:hypothetical protein
MAVNWALGLQQGPNAGEQFAQSFQQGQERARQNKARAAAAALVRDPNNQGALQALAEIDPQSAMQFREQQQKQALAGLEQHRDNILKGAQLIRQVQPKDQASWDQVRALATQMGIDVSEVPPQFDPQYANGLVSIADAFEPQKSGGPAMQQNYEWLKSQNPQLANQYLQRQAEGGPIVANNGDGTFTIIPRSQAAPQAGPQPGQVEDGYRFRGGNPADPNAWEAIGGQTGSAPSGGF